MPYEESAWRSLEDVIGSVLETAARGPEGHGSALGESEQGRVETLR
jgi:hypothetical protein